MKKRYFEKTNAETSLLGFGCMRFPVLEDGTINEELTFKMLDTAYEQGVNYYDTAYPYHGGESERVVGKWLQTKPRESLYVVSKSPVWKIEKPEDFDTILNEQLEKLQTSYLDFYLLHALSAERWDIVKKFDLIERAEKARAEGKIKRLGFSFHDEYEVFEDILNAHDWDFCQIQFNYMDTQIQAGLKGYELAKSKNIPMVIMEPIKGGQLANVPEEVKSVFQSIHPDWTDASWALRFVASFDNVYCVLSGMSDMAQTEDNLKTFNEFEPLTKEEFAAIAKAKDLFDARVQVPCTGCRYCMPCPFGVDIPQCFKILNNASIYNRWENGKKQYQHLEGKAELCQKCGACMTQCPQHIEIPDMLERVTEQLD
ncbi:MAG: aldo/keto reductase [Erysipelotrichaceae bacterium]|nr:aldo/keto reductase [Erysipelotrichaceae bacterium]